MKDLEEDTRKTQVQVSCDPATKPVAKVDSESIDPSLTVAKVTLYGIPAIFFRILKTRIENNLKANKGKNEYARYNEHEDGRNNGYLTIKSIAKPVLMKEDLTGMQLFKEECEGKVEIG